MASNTEKLKNELQAKTDEIVEEGKKKLTKSMSIADLIKAKKTVIKKALKYAPLKTDLLKAVSSDETIKNEIVVDMSEIQAEAIFSKSVLE